MSLLCSTLHSATAVAGSEMEAAVLTHGDLTQLVRRRPDVGVVLYRNVAVGLGRKLRRLDENEAGGI